MADILEKLSDEDLGFLQSGKLDNMSDEGLATVSKLPSESAPDNDTRNSLLAQGGLAVGGAALAGAGKIGLDAFIDWRNQPRLERNQIMGELETQQAPLGLKGRSVSSLPQRYGQEISKTKSLYSAKINNYNSLSSQAVKKLQSELSNFEGTVLNKTVDTAANFIKTKAPEFFDSSYTGYKKGLMDAEGMMSAAGKSFDTLSLDTEVISPTIKSFEKVLPQEVVAKISPTIPETGAGLVPNEKPLTVGQAKSHIKSIQAQLKGHPEAQHELSFRWGQYLEKNGTPEVIEKLGAINRSYKPIAEARTTINSLSKLNKGEFDDAGIYRLLKDYAKKGEDVSTSNLTQLLTEGNDISVGIEGLGEQIKAVEQSGVKVRTLEKAIKRTGESKQARLRAIREAAKKEVDNLVNLKERSLDLIDRARVAQKKVDNRSIMGKIPGVKNFISRGLPALGVSGNLLQAVSTQRDFEEFRKQAKQNPNSVSRLNPMTGIPEIINKEDYVL